MLIFLPVGNLDSISVAFDFGLLQVTGAGGMILVLQLIKIGLCSVRVGCSDFFMLWDFFSLFLVLVCSGVVSVY